MTKVKAMAPTRTLPKIQSGSGNMSQPHPASVAAINTSVADDKTSQGTVMNLPQPPLAANYWRKVVMLPSVLSQ